LTKRGVRFRVEYRLGGREESIRYAGTFDRKGDALDRRAWVLGEIAAMRVPDVRLVAPAPTVTLREVAERWRESRIDASDGTRARHLVELTRVLPVLGAKAPEAITKADVQGLVAKLAGDELARESIRKTVSTLAMVLDHDEISPNPARGVRLPEKDVEEVRPPTADHVEAIASALATRYRLPVLALEATGMRVGELDALTWGDVDEIAARWRVSAARTKTRRSRWVDVPAAILDRVLELVPREDRDLEARVFAEATADRLRTAIARACKATGTPLFSPHDLRHRRATLWHLAGYPAAEAAAWLGHSPQEHLRTYAHVVLDRRELDYATLLGRDRVVLASVLARSAESVV
jgi:integrase